MTIEVDGTGGGGTVVFDERSEGPELSRDDILQRAQDEILTAAPENRPDASTVAATRMTEREALETVEREGGAPGLFLRVVTDEPAWLVEVRGEFVDSCPGPLRPGRYVLVVGLDGSLESGGFLPDATPTATASPTPSPAVTAQPVTSPSTTASPEATATPLPTAAVTATLTAVATPSPPPSIYEQIQAGDLVIYGGTLIDGTGADPFADALVVVRGERIVAVASDPAFQPPAGTQLVEARGFTIMPGVIDSHAHITGDITGPDGLWYWLEEGVTTLRDIASIAGPADLKMLVAALGDRAPRVVVAGPIVTAPGGYPIPAYGSLVALQVTDPEDARAKVGALLDEGADIIKIALEPVGLPVMSLDTAQAITQLAHERGTVVTAHATPLEGVRLAIDAGVDSLAHSPLHVPPKEMVDEMIAKGMYVVSTLDIYGGQGANFLTPFAQAGGKVALGTDYGCCEKGYVPGGMPVEEMQLLLSAGLTPMQVLVAATKHGAEVSNLGAELGTIEPGKLADIIVVDGDPLVDINAMRDVTVVIKNGRLAVGEAVMP